MYRRRCGLMVSALDSNLVPGSLIFPPPGAREERPWKRGWLDSGPSGPGSSPGLGHCVVFLAKYFTVAPLYTDHLKTGRQNWRVSRSACVVCGFVGNSSLFGSPQITAAQIYSIMSAAVQLTGVTRARLEYQVRKQLFTSL